MDFRHLLPFRVVIISFCSSTFAPKLKECTMKERYNRNRIYVSEEEQEVVRNTRILLGGAGIGSVIAECALRFGFENITIIDGDKVELSNLNRQNYTENDLGEYKAESLTKRLLAINPQAIIKCHTVFLSTENVRDYIGDCDIAVNALDFKDETPFVFDEICKEQNIPVLHPYNFGWAGFMSIVKPDGLQLSQLNKNSDSPSGFELRVADYVIGYSAFWHEPKEWLERIVDVYKNEKNTLPPPQLAIASWITAGFCVNAMYNLVTGKDVKYFPKFYLSSLFEDKN